MYDLKRWSRSGSWEYEWKGKQRFLWEQDWEESGACNRFQLVERSWDPENLYLIDSPDNQTCIPREEARYLAGVLLDWAEGKRTLQDDDTSDMEKPEYDRKAIIRILRDAGERNNAGKVLMELWDQELNYSYYGEVYVVWERDYGPSDLRRFQDDCGDLAGWMRFASAYRYDPESLDMDARPKLVYRRGRSRTEGSDDKTQR